MATETGIITSISSSNVLEIESDKTGDIIQSDKPVTGLVVEDGVEYELNNGKAKHVTEITKTKVKGDLTDQEIKCLKSLIKSLNERRGGGKIEISIKTKG